MLAREAEQLFELAACVRSTITHARERVHERGARAPEAAFAPDGVAQPIDDLRRGRRTRLRGIERG